MEKDRISRVYSTGYDNRVWVVYPKVKTPDDAAVSQNARELRQRSDVRCLQVTAFDRDERGLNGSKVIDIWTCKVRATGQVIDIDRSDWPVGEFHERLVRELERRLGKTGLTIIADL